MFGGDRARRVRKNGAAYGYTFFNRPFLLRLRSQVRNFMSGKPDPLMRSKGVIGHDIRHDLLCNRFGMKRRKMITLEIPVVGYLPVRGGQFVLLVHVPVLESE